jgi:hypothetical protein
VSREGPVVHAGVEIGETLGELDLFAIDGNRAVCAALSGHRHERQVVVVDGEEPANSSVFEL